VKWGDWMCADKVATADFEAARLDRQKVKTLLRCDMTFMFSLEKPTGSFWRRNPLQVERSQNPYDRNAWCGYRNGEESNSNQRRSRHHLGSSPHRDP